MLQYRKSSFKSSFFRSTAVRGGDAARTSGFTLLEMLVGMAGLMVVAMLVSTFLSTWPSRFALQRSTREASFLISKARLEAIKRGVNAVVEADLTQGSLRAFADVNGEPGNANYLVYDPDPGLGSKQTDYEVGFLRLERSRFGDPPGPTTEIYGLTPVPGAPPGTPAVLVFAPTGKPLDRGAFRFADGNDRNFFETAVVGLTGKVEIRKHLDAVDSPTGSAGFFAEGKTVTGEQLWVWY